jgi:uncharacterized protein (TIGR02271 family)
MEQHMAEYIVAVFPTNEGASAAARDLETVGIPASKIRQYASKESVEQQVQPVSHTSDTHTSGGFWSWLFGEDSEATRSTYAADIDAYDRKTTAGNIVLSVTVDDDTKIHQAIAALEAHHPVDIDERSDDAEEREPVSSASPLTAHSTVGKEFSTAEVAQAGTVNTFPAGEPASSPVRPTGTAAASLVADTSANTPSGVAGAASGQEEVIPLAEEQLEVGKRTIDRGTTRIRRYVVAKPVEESVTLRGEKVTVERRQPIGTTAAPGAGAFEERVVEVRETAEEPVVSKTARVTEEVVVGREATERTETVRDTVRRDEIEVSNGGDGKR